ncbi:hypothetical protein [Algoriphagus halophilus]|uniref:Uncharacterized protein n=1 Tax=Algoriphagus halophilus TaxID=226505 RepID=A0A1N6GZ07_9BACT|nr:hypothetical protein [Algoriphagus halophilus]SIO12677.1 hypothetical protein SAMN05444394_3396 [Algoriphagus halophilus]
MFQLNHIKIRKLTAILGLFVLLSFKGYSQSSSDYLNNVEYTIRGVQLPTYKIIPSLVYISSNEQDYVIEIEQERVYEYDNSNTIVDSTLDFKFLVSKWVNIRTSNGPRGSDSTYERVLINIGYGNQGEKGTIVVTKDKIIGTGKILYLTPKGSYEVSINILISPSTNNL